jgi:serpin B
MLMRMMRWLVMMGLLVLPLFMGIGCATVPAPKPEHLTQLVEGNNAFAFELFKRICAEEPDKNVLISPYSISTALGMTYAGARGNTEKQMAEVLHFSLPQSELHPAFAELAGQMKLKNAAGCQLKIANALWGQQGIAFLPDFKRHCQKDYKGGFNTVNFAEDPEGSRATINRWIAKNTADKIKELLQPDDASPDTALILTNAIYFKGELSSKFEKKRTWQESFRINPHELVDVDMMSQQARFKYKINGYNITKQPEILEMPYAGEFLSIVLLLPDTDVNQFCASATAESLNGWLNSMEEGVIDVYLPKFKFETRCPLKKTLMEMGMSNAFAGSADFSGISANTVLSMKQVIHQTMIEMNEEGTEAAAATEIQMNTVGIDYTPSFRADRPFVFLIRHRGTGAILFMGKVMNPAA